MNKTILTLLGLVLAVSASIAAEPAITLESLVAKLPEAARTATQHRAIAAEAIRNPEFYQTLKGADWTFEGVKLNVWDIVKCKRLNKDWEAVSTSEAASHLDLPNYKTWAAYQVGAMGDTIAAYDWLQAQRLVLLGVNNANTTAKVEFVDALAAQILAAAKAKGN